MTRFNLTIGCGRQCDHPMIHPSDVWVSIDIDSKLKPDLVHSVSSKTLLVAMHKKKLIPASKFSIIFSEYLPIEEYRKKQFGKNIQTLLAEDGIFLINNLLPYDLIVLFKPFQKGSVFYLNNMTIITQSVMSFLDIKETIAAAKLKIPGINCLMHSLDNFIILNSTLELDFPVQNKPIILGIYFLLSNFIAHHKDPGNCLNQLFMQFIQKILTQDLFNLSHMVMEWSHHELARSMLQFFNYHHWSKKLRSGILFDDMYSYDHHLGVTYRVLSLLCILEPSLLTQLNNFDYPKALPSENLSQSSYFGTFFSSSIPLLSTFCSKKEPAEINSANPNYF